MNGALLFAVIMELQAIAEEHDKESIEDSKTLEELNRRAKYTKRIVERIVISDCLKHGKSIKDTKNAAKVIVMETIEAIKNAEIRPITQKEVFKLLCTELGWEDDDED